MPMLKKKNNIEITKVSLKDLILLLKLKYTEEILNIDQQIA